MEEDHLINQVQDVENQTTNYLGENGIEDDENHNDFTNLFVNLGSLLNPQNSTGNTNVLNYSIPSSRSSSSSFIAPRNHLLEDFSVASSTDHPPSLERSSMPEITAMTVSTSTKETLDYKSLQFSPFHKLGGRIEYFCVLNILPFLTAKELLTIGKTSKFFIQVTKYNSLWSSLYKLDFTTQPSNINNPLNNHLQLHHNNNNNNNIHNIHTTPTNTYTHRSRIITNLNTSNMISSFPISMKQQYKQRYLDYQERISRSNDDNHNLQLDMIRLDRIKNIEIFLDIIQIRLFTPLLFSCLLLSLILYVQRLDGNISIPIWSCALPLCFAFFYLIVCFLIIKIIHKRQYSTTSIVKGLYNYMRGPLVTLYNELLNESNYLLNIIIFYLLLIILQLGMIIVKLTNSIPKSFRNSYQWGIVFIPLWLLFISYCLLPFSKFRIDAGIFWFGFNMIWIPLFIFFICLTVKLDHDSSIRIALILIPFYIIEGSILLASLFILIGGIYR